MLSLDNKIALVTGASRGIGRAIAIELARRGAHVIVNYSSQKAAAEETLRLMGDAKKKSRICGFNVADEAEVNQAIESLIKEFSRIDILVNNAGISVDGLLLRLKGSDFDRQMGVNLKGAFNCSKACSVSMIKQRSGRIINISSVVGEMGNPGQSIYVAAKAGLIGMTKSLAKELARRNILVNAITPGYIETDMTKDIIEKGGSAVQDGIPLARVGKPEDVAYAAAFLASDDASYITGHVLAVNGGIYM